METEQDIVRQLLKDVLILIIMEDTHGVQQFVQADSDYLKS